MKPRETCKLVTLSLILMMSAAPVAAAVVTLAPSKDNTLFEGSPNRSCGVGPLFGGETLHFGARRIVIAFDIVAAVPPGATITGVELRMTVEGSGPAAQGSDVYGLHRVVADWSEKASICSDGFGALAEPGDATWDFRHFQTDAWTTTGGDFVATTSGSTAVPTVGLAAWASGPGLVADVQSWLDAPAGNFGWIILGNESVPGNARKFYSREVASTPSLSVAFTPPPAPPPGVPDGQSGSPVTLSKLSQDGANLRLSWDATLCSGNPDHHIVFGTKSGFPAALGGPFVVSGSVCHIGASSPFDWIGSPDPAVVDPDTGLVFVLVLADDGLTTEGSWGRSSLALERNGQGPNGSSAQCGIVQKNVSNTCGIGF